MLPWLQTSKELVFECRIFKVFLAGFRSQASGKSGSFNFLETKDWVNIVAVTPEKEALMVRQFRYGSGEVTLEFPAGCIEVGQTPEEAAARELTEETGATGSGWKRLGAVRPNPAIQNNTCHFFSVENVTITQTTNFDEFEEIEAVLIPLRNIDRLIEEGKITHAMAIVSWHLYVAKIRQQHA